MTIKEQFADSVKRGTGRAHLLIKQHPELDFSDEIIYAATNALAYDTQSEGSRALYVYELIVLNPNKGKVGRAIINAFKTSINDTWQLDQLYDIMSYCINDGVDELRETVYQKYDSYIEETADWIGEWAIINFDGVTGMTHIMNKRGQRILDGDEYVDAHMLDRFIDMYPEVDIKTAFPKTKQIKAFFKVWDKENKEKTQYKRPELSFDDILNTINTNQRRTLPPWVINKLTKEQIKVIADNFLEQSDDIVLENYLFIFGKVKFPLGYKPILNLVGKKVPGNSLFSSRVLQALSFFKNDEVRALALKKMKTKKALEYIGLLETNFKPGDEVILKELLDKANIDDIHGIAYTIRDLHKKHRSPAFDELLLDLYNKEYCTYCREDTAKMLIKNKLMPQHLREELKYDANTDTRKLYKKAIKG